MRISILGAYGNAGRTVARLLRQNADYDLDLLGRRPDRLDHAVRALEEVPGTGTVRAVPTDAADPAGLRRALEGTDLLLVAASVTQQVGAVAEAALDVGCDWFDLLLSVRDKHQTLRGLQPRMLEAGRCFVTDGGVHPGVPGALVRWAAARGTVVRAAVAARFGIRWRELDLSPATALEFADELTRFEPLVYVDGTWVRGWKHARRFAFGDPIGNEYCAPMYLAELGRVQEALPDLTDVGFFVAGFGRGVDYLVLPIGTVVLKVAPFLRRPVATLLSWGLETFGDTEGPSAVLLEAEYEGGARVRMMLHHHDAYQLTAIPAAATLLRWAEVRRPGMHPQAMIVDPDRFLEDLEGLGVEVRRPDG